MAYEPKHDGRVLNEAGNWERTIVQHHGRLHVAGVMDDAEAKMLVGSGVTHLGFPLELDHHAEDLSVEEAASIVSMLYDRATFFLITYLNRAPDIAALCKRLGVHMVQLHGRIAFDELVELREAAPHLSIIKSLIVRTDNTETLMSETMRYATLVDAFITDTFDAETGASGATGKTHDWTVSAKLAAASPKPLVLAGGLTPDNVGSAIRKVRPAGVDVHTGLEGEDGRKQADLTRSFVREVEQAFALGNR